MYKSFFLLLVFAALSARLSAQNDAWQLKINTQLWSLAQRPDSAVEFLIILQNQADVSAARKLRKKEDKGKYVFETLYYFAEKEQKSLRDMLESDAVPHQPFWIINALWAKGNASLLEKIAKRPEVGRLELNPIWHLNRPAIEEENLPSEERSALPWGLTKINADDVWNLGFKGEGIVVGGEDTGYSWEHPAIKDRYRGWNGTTADHNYNWHDAIHAPINGGANSCGLNLTAPCDDHDHGTHTVGTMVGNDGTDNIGVAPEATWIGCRNMEEGDGTPATYIECFEWFVAPTDINDANPDATKAPHVINNSWGCPTSEGCNNSNYADMEMVVENVRAAGIVVVVSAGNSGSACSTVDSPAAIYDASFTVGATNNSDNIAGFSSRGPVTVYTQIMKPDISAPGVSVHSCVGHDNNPATYAYADWNGTSMAGPHVAGVAALIMNARPNLIGDVDAIEDLMRNSAVIRFATAPFCGSDNGSSHPNNVYGWGRVDALAAVNAALPVELLEFTAKASGKTAQLRWVTATEKDCSHFSIQRSANGFSWQDIGSVACAGNGASTETTYQFEDPRPLQGLNYYRLNQVDYDGESSKSPARVLTFSPSGYSLRVTSGKGQAFFEVVGEDADEQTWQLDICALDGRLVQSMRVGAKGWLQLTDYPAGVYAVLLRDAEGRNVAVDKWLWAK